MKTATIFLVVLFGLSTQLLQSADSKRTAEYILTTPQNFEGKEIELDVAFVKPVRWKSPVSELSFFQAFTIDRKDHKSGGAITVAVPAADAASFAKKYGTDFEGPYDKDDLTGTLLSSPGRGPKRPVWFVDTSGLAPELIKKGEFSIEDDGKALKNERDFTGNSRNPKPHGPESSSQGEQ